MDPDAKEPNGASRPPALEPVAAWRYRAGLERVGLRVPGGRARHLGAIVTLPEGWPVEPLFRAEIPGLRVLPALPVATRRTESGPAAVPVLVRLDADVRGLRSIRLGESLDALLRSAYPQHGRSAQGATVRLGDPVPDAALAPEPGGDAPPWTPDAELGGRKPRAVVAVLDDGIPFAHRALRHGDGRRTRVEFCWLQGAAPAPAASIAVGAPATGREYRRDEINALLAAHGDDEDVLYHEAGATTPRYAYGPTIGRFGTHGSHALVAAAGPPDAPDADLVRLVAVQLAPATTLDTTGAGSEAAILAAVEYALDCAERIAAGYGCAELPLVLNFSYGYTGGPHDGTGPVAAAIRGRLDARSAPTALCLPAGNTFQARLAGQIRPPEAAPMSATLRWRVEPSDRTASPLELWFAHGADLAGLAIEAIDPTGFAAAAMSAGDLADPAATFEVRDRGGDVVGRIASRESGARRSVVLVLEPTDTPPGAPQARAGLWRVGLRCADGGRLRGPIDCRIGRDFNPMGYFHGARQSTFDPGEPLLDARGRPLASDDPNGFLRRFDTLNDLATDAAHTVVVAAAGASADEAADYSSAGALAGAGPAVDCAAPVETLRAAPGRRGAGTRSGATFRMSGTSVAAPRLAAEIADVFRRGQPAPRNPNPALMIGPVAASQTEHLTPRAPADAATIARGGRFEFAGDPAGA